MDSHLLFVANGFRVLGIALGGPGLAAFLVLAVAGLRLHFASPAAARSGTGSDPGSLIGLMTVGVNALGWAVNLAGAALEWVILVVAALLLAIGLLGTALFVTGRGLHDHRPWARIIAILLVMGVG